MAKGCWAKSRSTSEPTAGVGENEAEGAGVAGDSGTLKLGPINNSEVARYARGADVFVISHLNPPCPNNVIEAMACGLPIVGTNTGAMSELVNDNGLLVDVTDVKALAAAMHEAWQRRHELGLRSRTRAVKQFDLAEMAQQYAQALAL